MEWIFTDKAYERTEGRVLEPACREVGPELCMFELGSVAEQTRPYPSNDYFTTTLE